MLGIVLDVVGNTEMSNKGMLQPGTHILMIKTYFYTSPLGKTK